MKHTNVRLVKKAEPLSPSSPLVTQPTAAQPAASRPPRARRGVIYLVAGGRSYMGELLTSLESLRRQEPDLPVTLFSPYKPPASARCDHFDYQSEEHPLKQKVMILKESPYEETLFLDTDTFILRPVQQVFDYLANLDFAVANMFAADWATTPPSFKALVDPEGFNTGVLLYRKRAATLAFLKAWEEAIMPHDPKDMWAGYNCDQEYFHRVKAAGAMDAAGLKFGPLPNCEYNARGMMEEPLKKEGRWDQVRIFHHRTRAMKLRKALYSITDPMTAREVALKALDRVKSLVGAA